MRRSALLLTMALLSVGTSCVDSATTQRTAAPEASATPPGTPAPTLRDGAEFSSGFFTARSALIADNTARRHYGVAVSDIDGDGDFEAIVAGYGAPNRVLDWRQGRMLDVADRAYVMRSGEVVAEGSGAELLERDDLFDTFVGGGHR